MRGLFRVLIWALAPVLAAAPGGAEPIDAAQRPMSPLARLPASFEGPGPGADRALRWQVDLLPGGRFQWRQTDPAQPTPVDDIGGYALEGRALSLLGSRSEVRRLVLQDDGSLRPLDAEGRPTGGFLRRLVPPAPIAPRLRLAGLYTQGAGAARVVLCADGRSLPVAPAGDHAALARAHAGAGLAPGALAWAELEVLIGPPPLSPDPLAAPALVVERFVRLDARRACEGLRADRRLTGTDWRLEWLGDAPAAAADPSQGPRLRLSASWVAGSDGCNRLAGPVTRDGAALRFGALAGTRRACVEESAQPDDFVEALAQARAWTVRGDQLVLLDARGVTLVRLRAAR